MASRAVFRSILPTLRPTQSSLTTSCRRFASTSTEQRTAIVTGSARGIGKAVALRLAQDGYDVCVNDISANAAGIQETVAEVKKMGRNALGVEADVTDYEAVTEMVKRSANELGPLKTMVANAGIVQVKHILDLEEKDFETMFRVNVFGVQHCYKAAALQMIEQGTTGPNSPGKLIAASSIAAIKPFGMLAHYCASKHAVVGLTHNYAVELAKNHITANSYAPGIVGTDMWDQIDREIGKAQGNSLGEAVAKGEVLKKYSRELISLGRTSVPEDVSNLVSFMASKDSDYITGQTMVVDGGIVWR